MAQDLGGRLLRAGIVTRAQLTRVGEVPSGGRLVEGLVGEGLWEDAVAGYLVATGFGPLQQVASPASGNRDVVPAVPLELARELMAVPVGRRGSAVVVAMVDPSDARALERLRGATGSEVVPMLARHSDVARALSELADASDPSEAGEEVVVELVKKRTEHTEPFVPLEDPVDPDPEQPLPLVRPKAAADAAAADDRWATPPSSPPPPIDDMLDAIATAPSRDDIVDLACDAARTVARSVVFLALRRGSLQGFRGKGHAISPEALRGLSLSVDGPSTLADVVRTARAHDGGPGRGSADATFRSITHMRSERLVLQPVCVRGRVVGVLCADRVEHGHVGSDRIALVADAVGEAFHRLLATQRHD